MIFDYPSNKFIEDGKPSRLLINGFAFYIAQPVGFAVQQADDLPEEQSATVMKNIEFVIDGGILKIYAGNERITDITKLLFIMSESEVSTIKANINGNSNSQAMDLLSPELKISIQTAIEKMAAANGIVIPENINFFNDKFILYMYPLLRSMTNSTTNFYKILEDLRFIGNNDPNNGNYTIPQNVMEQTNISDALKVYIGTSSKAITKFVAANIVRKTDLVKSLSPQLLDILVNHSGKIFSSPDTQLPNVKILTCYEDIMIDVFLYVRYVMDIFKGNVDYTQRFLADKQSKAGYKVNKKVALFLAENLSPAKIFNVMDSEGSDIHSLSDTVDQYNLYKNPDTIPRKLKALYPNGLELPKNWKTIKELHDKISADYNKIKAEDNNKIIEYSPTEFQLHGLKDQEIELMLPSEGSTLVEWGRSQDHCVASYADRAARKSCIIMGVKIDGVHTYTLELRTHEHIRPVMPKEQVVSNIYDSAPMQIEYDRVSEFSCEVVQFRGMNNSSPDPKHSKRVRALIKTVFTAGVGANDSHALDAMEYLRA